MTKELFARFPALLFWYRVIRAFFASVGLWSFFLMVKWIISGEFTGLTQKLAWYHAVNTLWFVIGGTTIIEMVRIWRYAPRKEFITHEPPKDGFVIENEGKVAYNAPKYEMELLEKSSGDRSFWGRKLNEMKKKVKRDSSYKEHVNYCLSKMNESRSVIW